MRRLCTWAASCRLSALAWPHSSSASASCATHCLCWWRRALKLCFTPALCAPSLATCKEWYRNLLVQTVFAQLSMCQLPAMLIAPGIEYISHLHCALPAWPPARHGTQNLLVQTVFAQLSMCQLPPMLMSPGIEYTSHPHCALPAWPPARNGAQTCTRLMLQTV